jgi:hypothetical protein
MIPPHRAACGALTLVALLATAACNTTLRDQLAGAVTSDAAEIFVRPAFGTDQRARLAILPFKAPPYAAGAAPAVTESYFQELLRGGAFREVTLLPEVPPGTPDGIPWEQLKNYDLALQGEILHLLAGSGSMPTQLKVEIRIIDVSRRTLAWYLRQQSTSQPGQDVNLVWSTVPGEPARPYQQMAAALGRQLVQILMSPDPNRAPRPGLTPARTPN